MCKFQAIANPIAAAIVGRAASGTYSLQDCNAKFAEVIAQPGVTSEERKAGLFDLGPIGEGLRSFFDDDADTRDFTCRTGEQVGARHLSIKLASLASEVGARRCLMSVVDRGRPTPGPPAMLR